MRTPCNNETPTDEVSLGHNFKRESQKVATTIFSEKGTSQPTFGAIFFG